MRTPKVCPVCGHDSMRPVNRAVLVKLEYEEVPGLIAYRCGKGHLCLVASPKKKTQKKG